VGKTLLAGRMRVMGSRYHSAVDVAVDVAAVAAVGAVGAVAAVVVVVVVIAVVDVGAIVEG
jgi:hypothetical protein